jgi:hypothetical protein
MKTLKSITFLMLISLLTFSCTNNNEDELTDPNETNETTEKSASAKIVVEVVKSHLKTDGSFYNTTNPESSMTFDLGFKFSYPISISYNNSTKVQINSIEELASVAKNISATNYIDGISFPFEIDKDGTKETINSENDFIATINSKDTDNDGTPDYQDTDDDGDGANDIDEDANHDGDSTNDDADNDGVANYQDTDSDNDGQLDQDEDNDGDGDFTNDDSDNDGTPDYTDTDSDNDGTDDGDDDDDDNDGTNDNDEGNDNYCNNCNANALNDILLNCTNWVLDELELNNIYAHSQYNGYTFTFNSNGSVIAKNSNNSINGTWSSTGTGNNVTIVITLSSLTDINGTWNLKEIEQENGQKQIQFKKQNGDELTFKSNC